MQTAYTFDVLIIGGGPAGLCAALRLLSLGRRVALVEKADFPRPQIGESLSPGIWNLFRYLQAEHLLSRHHYLHQLPASVIWEKETPDTLNATQRGPGVMLDRGLLDHDLLQLAVERGLQLFQPARFERCSKTATGWKAHLRMQRIAITVDTNFILDARGRSSITMQNRILTATPVLAVWSYVPAAAMPQQTLVEATPNGWIWGSPMPDQRFRILSFISPAAMKHRSAADVFRWSLRDTQLFGQVPLRSGLQDLSTCMVFTYAHAHPWNNGYIRLGEAAFSLDPLSSTGVEKAMRFSLQAVVAVNTILESGDEQMGRSFYEDSMIASVISHMQWTAAYYAKAWPAAHPFWKERAVPFIGKQSTQSGFHQRLQDRFSGTPAIQEPVKAPVPDTMEKVRLLWNEQVRLSPALSFYDTPCVVGNVLAMKKAVRHPRLKDGIAYLGEIEISVLLSGIAGSPTFGSLVQDWSKAMPVEQAVKTALFCWNHELLTFP
ncbi:MAG TPA: tryptophan 7-halogenase [Chitinophaga sp.]